MSYRTHACCLILAGCSGSGGGRVPQVKDIYGEILPYLQLDTCGVKGSFPKGIKKSFTILFVRSLISTIISSTRRSGDQVGFHDDNPLTIWSFP